MESSEMILPKVKANKNIISTDFKTLIVKSKTSPWLYVTSRIQKKVHY